MPKGFGFQYSIDCPICGDHGKKSDCRRALDTQMVFCKNADDNHALDGWLNKGTDGTGVFTKFVEQVEGEGESVTPRKLEQQRKKREKQQERIREKTLNPTPRNSNYSRIKEQTKLKPEHKQELLSRGLSEESIEKIGFRSTPEKGQHIHLMYDFMPGFYKVHDPRLTSAYYYQGKQGFFCPAYNPSLIVQGYQVRTDSQDDAKYVWSRSYHDDGIDAVPHLKNGELPLSYWKADEVNPKEVNLIEGILKPQIAAEIHGGQWIGAAGGQFLKDGKPTQQLTKWLEYLEAKTVTLFPDAGAMINFNVRNQLWKIAFHLQELGYTVQVANWGQFKDKSAKDWDELPKGTPVELLTFAQFRNIWKEFEPKEWNDVISRITSAPSKENLRKIETYNYDAEIVEYRVGTIPQYQEGVTMPKFVIRNNSQRKNFYKEAKQKGWKYVLDTSTTGSGKSYDVGEMRPDDFFTVEQEEDNHKLFYLTKSSRNPTTETIEQNFYELPTRHSGFIRDSEKRTPLGKPYRYRAKPDDEEKSDPNCHWEHRFHAVAEKNLRVDLCGICPFKQDCKAGSGNGYGFKSEIMEAMQYSRIRANPQGISPDMAGDHTVAIVDEYSQTLEPYKLIEVGSADWMNANYELRDLSNSDWEREIFNRVADVSRLIQRDKSRYGLNHNDIIKTLSQPPEWLGNAIHELETLQNQDNEVFEFLKSGEEYDEQIRKSWLIDFLKVWNGELDGAFSGSQNTLQILIRNEHLLEVLDGFGYVIFQDATGSKRDLANKIKCKEDEILEVAFTNPTKENLDLIHVTGLGRVGKDRSQLAQNRVNALVSAFEQEHGKDEVGFIDYKSYAKPNWLHHFSDGRGSNAHAEKSAIASFGIPYPQLGALAQEYTLWTGEAVDLDSPSDEFQKLVGERTASEIIQELGRLRANRRQDKQLTYYLIGDLDLTFLSERGYRITQKSAIAFSPEAGDRVQQTAYKIYHAVKTYGEMGYKALTKKIDKAKSTIQRTIQKMGGLRQLQEIIEQLLYGVEYLEPTEDQDWAINKYLPQCILDGENTLEQLIETAEAFELSYFQIIAMMNITTKAIVLLSLFSLDSVPKYLKKMLKEFTLDLHIEGTTELFLDKWYKDDIIYSWS